MIKQCTNTTEAKINFVNHFLKSDSGNRYDYYGETYYNGNDYLFFKNINIGILLTIRFFYSLNEQIPTYGFSFDNSKLPLDRLKYEFTTTVPSEVEYHLETI